MARDSMPPVDPPRASSTPPSTVSTRDPAVVFDGDAVVCGVTNIDEALGHYRQWKGRALR
jgi:hypothetical protein